MPEGLILAGDHAGDDPFEKGVLFDERLITRREALQRFFTPRDGCEDMPSTQEELVSVGKTEYCFLNPRSSFVAPQIRDAYDADRILRTGRNIRDSDDGQLQNCAVAFVDADNIDQYLQDLNDYFGSDITTDDLRMHDEWECYIITVFGHNRQLGIAGANLESNGHPDTGVLMMAKVFRNPDFWRVIEAQAVENTGISPPMWDRARSIVMYKKMRVRDGIPPTQQEVAEKFNVDVDQIWRAERYDALPHGIKELVMQKRLPYSGAFELDILIEPYGEEYVTALAAKLAARSASGPQIMKTIRKYQAALKLTPEARLLVEEGALRTADAIILADAADILTAGEINEVVTWIALNRPEHKDVKARVDRIYQDKLQGNMSMFDADASDPGVHDAVEAKVRQLRDANTTATVQRGLITITQLLTGLRAATKAGLLGDIVGKGFVENVTPEQLLTVLENSLAEGDIDPGMLASLEAHLRSLADGDDERSHIIDGILSTLHTLQHETPARQQAKRAQLGALVVGHASESQQVGLF